MALCKIFLGLEYFGALQVPELGGPALDACADDGNGGHEFRVDVTLHDLCRDRRRLEPELAADVCLDLRRQMRACADCAGQFADGDARLEGLEPFKCAAELVVHQGHLEAEGGRLGVDAVAAADHRSVHVLARLGSDDLPETLDVGDENLERLVHLHRECRVDDVAAGQAKVQPAAGRFADVFRDVGGEGDDVVVQRLFEFAAAFDGEGGVVLHLLEVFFGDESLVAKCLGREQFDVQPDFEFSLFRPNVPHLGTGITSYHARTG